MKKIKGVKFGNVEVVLEGERDSTKDYDFGALTLKCEDREFILDVVQSYTEGTDITENGTTVITLKVEPDEETFDECPYNLTKQDLLDFEKNNLVKELFIDGTFENNILSITFHFEVDGKDYQFELEQEK